MQAHVLWCIILYIYYIVYTRICTCGSSPCLHTHMHVHIVRFGEMHLVKFHAQYLLEYKTGRLFHSWLWRSWGQNEAGFYLVPAFMPVPTTKLQEKTSLSLTLPIAPFFLDSSTIPTAQKCSYNK